MSTSHHTVPATGTTAAHTNVHGTNNAHHVADVPAHGTTTSAYDQTRHDNVVKTGGYTTGAEGGHGVAAPAGHAVPVTAYNQSAVTGTQITNQPNAGAQLQNTVPNAANRDGLVVNDGIGGARGGAAILGGQGESEIAKATTVNPGINIGVSTTQYTAPAGTSGIGGGVAERGTGIAGLVHAITHPFSHAPVDKAHEHCECVKKNGSCSCPPGTCACSVCTGLRAAELAKAKAHEEKAKHGHGHHDTKDTHHHDTHHGHTAAAVTTAAATTHATHATHATHPVATTAVHTTHTNTVPVVTGHATGHPVTKTNNIDGDGHQATHFGQGTTVGAPVHTTGSTVTGAHTANNTRI